LKCDELGARRAGNFEPESPFVVVCEGFQDSGFICALLKHLHIENCDVTFPKKKMGKSGISEMVRLLVAESGVKGIAIVRDADGDPDGSFAEARDAFVDPFEKPKESCVIHRGKHRISAVFLIPGKTKKGTLEHLLFEAVSASHADVAKCVKDLEACARNMAAWDENKKAKMRMQSAIASFCEDDPGCSLGFIWHKKADNPIEIASPCFKELADFLAEFCR
jgi:hypothetical protein